MVNNLINLTDELNKDIKFYNGVTELLINDINNNNIDINNITDELQNIKNLHSFINGMITGINSILGKNHYQLTENIKPITLNHYHMTVYKLKLNIQNA